jgi:hypothetical protein
VLITAVAQYNPDPAVDIIQNDKVPLLKLELPLDPHPKSDILYASITCFNSILLNIDRFEATVIFHALLNPAAAGASVLLRAICRANIVPLPVAISILNRSTEYALIILDVLLKVVPHHRWSILMSPFIIMFLYIPFIAGAITDPAIK